MERTQEASFANAGRAIQIRPDSTQKASVAINSYNSLAHSQIPKRIEIEKCIGSPELKQRLNVSSLSLEKSLHSESVTSKPIKITSYRSGNVGDGGKSDDQKSSMNHYPWPQRQEVSNNLHQASGQRPSTLGPPKPNESNL